MECKPSRFAQMNFFINNEFKVKLKLNTPVPSDNLCANLKKILDKSIPVL
ncbi:MAG: hypothetical protein Q8O10_05165 [candidate division Zixibacteria bacterium]|nr:hypothetical protein [candidate division Zixibacteria bacterium]